MKISRASLFNIFFFSALFLIYSALSYGRYFLQDDFAFLIHLRAASLWDVLGVFTTPIPGGIFYRPTGVVFYLVDAAFWRTNVFMYFIHSILWQLMSIYLVFLLVRKLAGTYAAIFAEVIFILYFPLNSGSVSLIGNRLSVIAIVFYLASLIFFIAMRKREHPPLNYSLSVLFFALALFAKENSLTLLPVLLAYDILFEKKWISGLWAYIPFVLVIFARYFAGVMFGLHAQAGRASSAYMMNMGMNIFYNSVYYLVWLAVPAVVIIAAIMIAMKAMKIKFKFDAMFPWRISLFGLAFALLNMAVFVVIKDYRQLGWMHLSTIGMAIFLCAPAQYAFSRLTKSGRRARKGIAVIVLAMLVLVCVLGALFIPEKVIKRNRSSLYARKFVEQMISFNFPQDKKIYVVDEGSKDYKLSDTFVSPMAERDVISDAMSLYVGDKAPKNIRLIEDMNDVKKIKRGRDTVILVYKDGTVTRTY